MNTQNNNIKPYFELHIGKTTPLDRKECHQYAKYEREGSQRPFLIAIADKNDTSNYLSFQIDSYNHLVDTIDYTTPNATPLNKPFSYKDKYIYKESAIAISINFDLFNMRDSIRQITYFDLERDMKYDQYNDALVVWIDENQKDALYYFYEKKVGVLTDKNLNILAFVLFDFTLESCNCSARYELAFNEKPLTKKTSRTIQWILFFIIIILLQIILKSLKA